MSISAARRGFGFLVAIALAVLPAASQTLTAAASGSGTLFGVTSSLEVVAIDPASGALTPVADVSNPQLVLRSGLADDPATHRLFMAQALLTDPTTFAIAAKLVIVDSRGGVTPAVVPLAQAVTALNFDTSSGSLFGVTLVCCPRQVVRINLSDGTETNVGPFFGDTLTPSAIAPALSTLYLISWGIDSTNPNFTIAAQLWTVNTVSGIETQTPNLRIPVEGLVYDSSSNALFGVPFFSPFGLLRINPTDGSETPVGTYDLTGFGPGIGMDSASHTAFFSVFNSSGTTSIVSLNDQSGIGVPGNPMPTYVNSLVFEPVSITPDSIKADVRTALASGAIDNAGVANALLAQLNAAAAARQAAQCANAASIYTSFISLATAQSGQHIAAATSSNLISEAQFLIAHCP
jgi:hypothetical protein